MREIIKELQEYRNRNYIHIAKYLLSLNDYTNLTSAGIQEECHVSAGTVTKFVRSLGYQHFLELKFTLIVSSKTRKRDTENYILSVLMENASIDVTNSMCYMLTMPEANIILSGDINNISLVSELNNNLVKSSSRNISYCPSTAALISKIEKINENGAVLIYLGELNKQFEYVITQNDCLEVYNITEKNITQYKSLAKNIHQINISTALFGEYALYLYVTLIMWIIDSNQK